MCSIDTAYACRPNATQDDGSYCKATACKASSDIVGPAWLAGVPEEQIQEMLRLATKGRTRLADLPVEKNKQRRHVNVLSESEEVLLLPSRSLQRLQLT